jgi:hypothetical protein
LSNNSTQAEEKKQLSWRTSDQPPPLGGRWIISFCIFFFCFIFNNYTLSDNMGLAWVWPVKGVFLLHFLSSPLHHITAGCSRVQKAERKVGSSWEDRGFRKEGYIFEND